MNLEQNDVVTKSIVVEVPREHAFRVFTERLDLWWPRGYRIGKVDMAKAILEGKEGGRWYERGVDGSECEWGRVLVWSPPNTVVLSWHIDATFQYVPDPARASRVEVTFNEEPGNRTRVNLRHADLARHGEGWERSASTFSGDGGWSSILAAYAQVAAS